uniref:Uncharacterized protein n=1 Tax=Arundo donax TaxID=35708 RepID=A0A0A9CRG9_ARUDO
MSIWYIRQIETSQLCGWNIQ